MTLFRLLTEGTRDLEQSGNPDARNDARQLLLAAFHLDMAHFLLNRMQPLPDTAAARSATDLYRAMIARRRRREPLQHILGSQEFMGLEFYVNPHVLIPRQDTETLVEQVLAEQKEGAALLDLCTGSGCIAISLAVKGNFSSVTATDISEEALKVAKRNAAKLLGAGKPEEDGAGASEPEADGAGASEPEEDGTRAGKPEEDGAGERKGNRGFPPSIIFYQGDLFQAIPADPSGDYPKYDIITANPPYIPTAVIRTLQPEVRDHEPMLALDGNGDGVYYYSRIARDAKHYLTDQGALYLEIGHDQGATVSAMLEEQGYRNIRVIKDLPGNDRVICAVWP